MNTNENVLLDKHVFKIAKMLEDNNPMQSIYEHNDEELLLLKTDENQYFLKVNARYS